MIRNSVILNGFNSTDEGGYVPSLNISDTSFHFLAEGGIELYFVVTVADATQVWAYEISTGDDDWLSVIGASLVGTDTMKISCDAQPAGIQPPRGGTITFTSGTCAPKVLTISQAARAG